MGSLAAEEEALKAIILSHVRAIHGPKYPRGTVFDVVSGYCPGQDRPYACFVVVYPETKPFKAGEVVSADWSPIESSGSRFNAIQAHQDLLTNLRTEMIGVMGEAYRKKAKERSAMNSSAAGLTS